MFLGMPIIFAACVSYSLPKFNKIVNNRQDP